VRALAIGLIGAAACGRIAFDPLAPVEDYVVRYPMDDDPTTGTVTATVAGYDGQCTTCPTATTGHIAGGYSFAGLQSIALPAISTGLVGAKPYTVTLWVLPETGGPQLTMVAKPDGNTAYQNVFNLFVAAGQQLVIFETTMTGNDVDSLQPPQVNPTGAWHHVAASWDGGTKRLYIDGMLVGQETTPTIDTSDPLTVGADVDNQAPDNWFVGTMDDLRFYARVLSDAEVAQLAGS
jgi:hypothetical protein